ncbi:MAG TPA: ABC transporter substrate-binding protein [Dermatophilaceae bacterium]|nr:ABC transporter substrate-binding protein [Dermatophilaceae bacterium]
MARSVLRRVAVAGGAGVLATLLAACSELPSLSDDAATQESGPPQRGGDLRVLVTGTISSWDPQLMYVGPESFFAQRTFVRTLTTYGTGEDQRKVVGDLATDTGKSAKGGRQWSFTLRKGVRWQDGSPVTCEDVRHGVARTFDRTTHIAGTNYASFLLDVPTEVTPEGLEKPVYRGPTDKRNQAAFNKAVTCAGPTITFNLRTAEPDFAHLVALPEFAPRKAKSDTKEAKATYTVNSTGPYRLDGTWQPGKGGTFVRNEQWDPETDPVRKAYPDRIRVESGLDGTAVIQRLLNGEGDDAKAVSWVQASPTLANQAASSPQLRARTTFPWTGEVDYLALNMRSPVMSNPTVRQAFELATNRATFVSANGGDGAGEPSWSVLSPVVSQQGLAPEGDPPVQGDPEGSKKLLAKAGLKLPVKVRVVYAQSLLADKAYAALEAGWERGGFDVALNPVPPEEYYKTIERPKSVNHYDVFRGVWRPDWPSAGAVLPALFDARINIDSSSPGQDVGYFADAAVGKTMDKATATADPEARAKVWEQVDALIRAKGGYVALSSRKAMYIHGGGVRGYTDHVVGGIVDLATLAVE